MREALLHFIWRNRYFNQQQLLTESGERLEVLSPGEGHADQGPDFRMARIRIGDRVYEGPVELHILASDWVRHAHDGDVRYQSIILHVVWVNDRPQRGLSGDGRGSGAPAHIPVLALEQRVPKLLLARYAHWMDHTGFVPCERQLGQLDPGLRKDWLRELAERRLRRRTLEIASYLEKNCQHWEGTTWLYVARSMGQPVNGASFEAMAQSLPVELLARHRSDRTRLEALLLGQAGLLDGVLTDAYPRVLQREYRFLRGKWALKPVNAPVSFLRMRPAHFPTIRLAQLADLLRTGAGWFALVRDAGSPGEVLAELRAEARGYWIDHFVPDQLSSDRPKRMGAQLRQNILINAFIPILYAYGRLRGEAGFQEKAMRWLHETAPERNRPIDRWAERGIVARHAADTQALLELRAGYCASLRCLDCAMGRAIFGSTAETAIPRFGADGATVEETAS